MAWFLHLLDAYDPGRLGDPCPPTTTPDQHHPEGAPPPCPKFSAAQAATLATRDARQANIIAEINPNPYNHDAQVAKLLRDGYHVEMRPPS